MAYSSTPYVEMALKTNGGHIKNAQNDTLEMSALDYSVASMNHIRNYRVLPWAV